MEDGDYITGVRESDGGYLINFAKAGPVFIKDGVDGLNGKDAEVPDIDIVQDADGYYYWVINGNYITYNGQKIRVNGKDGKDGKDAVSPQVRINPTTSEWEISADGGNTWTSTGTSAKGKDGANGKDGKDGADGKDGKDGKDGENGKDGKDGNQFFMTVTYEVNSDGEFMTITTQSGQTFRIPIYKK